MWNKDVQNRQVKITEYTLPFSPQSIIERPLYGTATGVASQGSTLHLFQDKT